MARRRQLTGKQLAAVNAILNDGRRVLLEHIKTEAKRLRRSDAFAARELLRIAEYLHGFTPQKRS
jgi:hypothetical protein